MEFKLLGKAPLEKSKVKITLKNLFELIQAKAQFNLQFIKISSKMLLKSSKAEV